MSLPFFSARSKRLGLTLFLALLGDCVSPTLAQSPGAPKSTPNLEGNIERPLRYHPEGTDFVITNSPETFNRPLYGGGTAFRVEAGDRPQYALYLPGRGGVLRLGFRTSKGQKWCDLAKDITARYRPGSMLHEIRDPLLGPAVIRLAAVPYYDTEGLSLRVEIEGALEPVELFWAFGGISGQRGRRDADIGTENEPVSTWFQLKPEHCKSNSVQLLKNQALLKAPKGQIICTVSEDAIFAAADASGWSDPAQLLQSAGHPAALPVSLGRLPPKRASHAVYISLQRLPQTGDDQGELSTYLEVRSERADEKKQGNKALLPAFRPEELASRHAQAEEHRRQDLAEKVVVDTPDPYLNAAVGALNLAADGVWDLPTGTVMHGAVAWRSKLLGWRGPYLNDALGYHDRARSHIDYWSGRQNTSPVPETIPPADADANLSRSEAALHSNGDLSNSHYDMNLVFIDMVFRHLLWTGDLDLARRLWPMIERHLAWERRLFRRPFGPDGLPLYEAYCCIWASDDLFYSGGGTTHSSAYNVFHNRMAARIARLIGQDPTPYEREADDIQKAMRRELWLSNLGWYAEWRDVLGLKLAHSSPALWTFYHTLDSQAASPLEAWQMTRFIDTQLAHIPLRGPGVPAGGFHTLPTTNWMPYTWSTNNVVMSEVTHTALGFWQAGRPEEAWKLYKGALLDSMFMGLCPGNAGMCTQFDVARREAQRDFADSVGMTSRALIEGLFGVAPDALAGELRVRPGFPVGWDHATLHHPDLDLSFRRSGREDLYHFRLRFAQAQALRLQILATHERIGTLLVNGKPGNWKPVSDSVGRPSIEILSPASSAFEVRIVWEGAALAPQEERPELSLSTGEETRVSLSPARILEIADPQQAFVSGILSSDTLSLKAVGTPGHRSAFVRLNRGELTWWQPIPVCIREASEAANQATDWSSPLPQDSVIECVDLRGRFNDRVTRIFKNQYLSPRASTCSLSMPTQGMGSWCHPKEVMVIDDSGLRSVSARNQGVLRMPNGLIFATPGQPDEANILFTSLWDNYPRESTVPLRGRASRLYLLMAGSTHSMLSRFDNGEVIVTYADGSSSRLALENPGTWWPIGEDYFIDDYAFRRPGAIPPRIDLKTGQIRIASPESFKGKGGKVPGGAATVLELQLDPSKELRSFTVRALANEVVVGLMSATLRR
jgi:hypothetical protein